jgi:hypothetical protein
VYIDDDHGTEELVYIATFIICHQPYLVATIIEFSYTQFLNNKLFLLCYDSYLWIIIWDIKIIFCNQDYSNYLDLIHLYNILGLSSAPIVPW